MRPFVTITRFQTTFFSPEGRACCDDGSARLHLEMTNAVRGRDDAVLFPPTRF